MVGTFGPPDALLKEFRPWLEESSMEGSANVRAERSGFLTTAIHLMRATIDVCNLAGA